MLCCMVAMSIMLFACGGNADAIREKAEYYVMEGYKAGLVGDYDRIERLMLEEQIYVNSLDADEQEIYQQATIEAASELLY